MKIVKVNKQIMSISLIYLVIFAFFFIFAIYFKKYYFYFLTISAITVILFSVIYLRLNRKTAKQIT